MTIIDEWMSFDDATKKEIERLQREDPEELKAAFSKTLAFGTAGMREKWASGPIASTATPSDQRRKG